jgi:hypothetical protein
VQRDRLLLLVITVIRYTRERKKTRSQITYQIATKDYMIFWIFHKKTITITYFILNVYLENIKTQPVYLQETSHNKTQPQRYRRRSKLTGAVPLRT